MDKKSKVFAVVTALLLLLALSISTAFAAPAPKVDVCHFDAEYGTYHLINISENAFQAHVDHGDGSPGNFVHGMPGKMFGADCSLLDVNANVAGTWMGRSGIAGNMTYYFSVVLNQDPSGNVTGTIDYYSPSVIHRYVSGTVSGDNFTFRTYSNLSDPNQAYWADCSSCAVTVGGTHFHGFGYDSNGVYVEFEADK